MVNIQNLIDDAKCFETVRDLRWSDGIFCPPCGSARLIKRGFDDTKGRKGRRNRLKGRRGRGTLAGEKPPILGLIQHGGDVCIQMLENVQQKTMEPLIKKAVIPDTLIYTDEYNIYGRLAAWGYAHAVVHHSQGEFARDDDQDGFGEVPVNTIEGFWSLLRSWLRPHRGSRKSYTSLQPSSSLVLRRMPPARSPRTGYSLMGKTSLSLRRRGLGL